MLTSSEICPPNVTHVPEKERKKLKEREGGSVSQSYPVS